MPFAWTEIGVALQQRAPLVPVPTPPHGMLEWRTAPATFVHEDDNPAAQNASPAGRDELEIDRNHWKREALRYKQLLMDMLGKEVE